MGLAEVRGINWNEITKFDKAHSEYLGLGHHKDAPYYKEHMEAEKIEKIVIKMFGLYRDEYEKIFNNL